MATIDTVRRIILEDFKKEDQELVSILAGILNNHMEQVYNAFDGRIDFTNTNQEIVDITVIVDADGKMVKSEDPTADLVTNPQFSTQTVTNVVGTTIIRAINRTNSTLHTDSAPFIHYSKIGDNSFKIEKINGLIAYNKYSLKILIYG